MLNQRRRRWADVFRCYTNVLRLLGCESRNFAVHIFCYWLTVTLRLLRQFVLPPLSVYDVI